MVKKSLLVVVVFFSIVSTSNARAIKGIYIGMDYNSFLNKATQNTRTVLYKKGERRNVVVKRDIFKNANNNGGFWATYKVGIPIKFKKFRLVNSPINYRTRFDTYNPKLQGYVLEGNLLSLFDAEGWSVSKFQNTIFSSYGFKRVSSNPQKRYEKLFMLGILSTDRFYLREQYFQRCTVTNENLYKPNVHFKRNHAVGLKVIKRNPNGSILLEYLILYENLSMYHGRVTIPAKKVVKKPAKKYGKGSFN